MTLSCELPTSKATIGAATSVLNLLPHIAGFAVGFSGLAYISGWREVSSYYQELGAPWVLPLLTASQVMQTSIWLISLISIVSFISVLSLVEGSVSQKWLRRWSIIFLLFATVTFVLPFSLDGRVSASVINFLTGVTSIFWAISAGFTIGELIACLALDKLEWGDYHIFLLYFVVFYGFHQAPSNMGRTRATLAVELKSSSLPKVDFVSPQQSGDWRLVGPCGDKLLLVSLAKEYKDRRFKLVSSESIDEIHTHGHK